MFLGKGPLGSPSALVGGLSDSHSSACLFLQAPKVRRQSDLWGPWGSWGPCSRTCGGGISFRERPCYSQR